MNEDIKGLIKRNKHKLPKEDIELLDYFILVDTNANSELIKLNKQIDYWESEKLKNNIKIIQIFQKHNI